MARLKTLKPRLQALETSRRPTLAAGSWRSDKPTAAKRGYGYRWQKARELFLSKRPLCCACEAEGRVVVATVVDHIEPHRGNDRLFWDEANWQPLCKAHHDAKTQLEKRV